MILMKDIIKEGNPLLKQKSVDVNLPISDEDANTLNTMIEYIFNSIDPVVSEKYGLRPAVGIAAPQIGILKKMIVINAIDEDGVEHFYAIVNPKLMSYSDELTHLQGGEGCLSVEREAKGLIHRHKRVTVKGYFLEDGKLVNKTIKLKGYLAIVFQHEYDHLFGTLFVDRINPVNPFEVPSNSTPVVFKDFEDIEE
jgi:peptide deformylase